MSANAENDCPESSSTVYGLRKGISDYSSATFIDPNKAPAPTSGNDEVERLTGVIALLRKQVAQNRELTEMLAASVRLIEQQETQIESLRIECACLQKDAELGRIIRKRRLAGGMDENGNFLVHDKR